jgi:muconolactone delta-isomerase
MKWHRTQSGWWNVLAVVVLAAACAHSQAQDNSNALVTKVSDYTSVFLDQVSNVKCTEVVQQQKLAADGKVERTAESTYDYLIILSNSGGELNLNESRLELRPAKLDRQKTSLLVTNGFATLFLVFHPYYASSFQFTALDDEPLDGRNLSVLAFKHIPGTRSPAALALRGREYPLELSGKAWIDPRTGSIAKMTATIGTTMEDVGLKTMDTEVDYAPVAFQSLKETYWFPARATVEVETARQHWRNTHKFSDYKLFSVETNEKVAANK